MNPPRELLQPDEEIFREMATILTPARPAFTRFTWWDRELQSVLESIEESAFPPALRYSYEEMLERAGRPGFEGILVSDPGGATPPAAIMIVYRPGATTVYLDTLAVRSRGRGIGSALLRFLIRRCAGVPGAAEVAGAREAPGVRGATGAPGAAPPAKIREIRLDAEGGDSEGGGGAPLPAYYQRFGFRVVAEEATGNVTMVLPLRPGGAG
ncbi:MAG: GNAT family N-acetyltransferase [Spirochaetaceae bacterium]|nr:MAG: GNAT family N-acetyltransferase [Spirochaetaceae bacterium]